MLIMNSNQYLRRCAVNKTELVKELRRRVEKRVPRKLARMDVVEVTVEELLDLIKETVWKGEAVSIRNFGKFYLKKAVPRVARNPKTGEPVQIPERFVPAFKVGKGFKNYKRRK